MDILDQIVKDCLEQHKEGEKFFDHLDKAIQQKPIVNQLLDLIGDNKNIIVSGKFGWFLSMYLGINVAHKYRNFLVVNGGLRKGEKIKILDLSYQRDEDLNGLEFIFVDDSFYSGKTRDAVKENLNKYNAKLIHTYVVYDGSKKKDETVSSLYRYYDNYKGEI